MGGAKPETEKPPEPRNRTDLDGILVRVMDEEGVLGVSVVDRRGNPVVARGAARIQNAMLYPLIATLAGAGHLALEELEANADVRVVAKSDRTRIHIAGVDDEHLIVTVADNSRPWGNIRPRVNQARKELREALAKGDGATKP